LLPTYIYVKWGGIISVKKSDLERVKYLERAGKWFKIRAVMIVLVFAGTILAMVAMATLAPVAPTGFASPSDVIKFMATTVIATIPRMLIATSFAAVWSAILAVPLANLGRYFRISSEGIAAVVVACSLIPPMSLALMYNSLVQNAHAAVNKFLEEHAAEFSAALSSEQLNPQVLIELNNELTKILIQVMQPVQLMSFVTAVVPLLAAFLVLKVAKEVKATSVKALGVVYIIMALFNIASALSSFASVNIAVLMVAGAVSTVSLIVTIAMAVLEWVTGSRLKIYATEVRKVAEEAELLESAEAGS